MPKLPANSADTECRMSWFGIAILNCIFACDDKFRNKEDGRNILLSEGLPLLFHNMFLIWYLFL